MLDDENQRTSIHLIWSRKHSRILKYLSKTLPTIVPPGVIVQPTLLHSENLNEIQNLINHFLAENVAKGNDLVNAQTVTEINIYRFLTGSCLDLADGKPT